MGRKGNSIGGMGSGSAKMGGPGRKPSPPKGPPMGGKSPVGKLPPPMMPPGGGAGGPPMPGGAPSGESGFAKGGVVKKAFPPKGKK